MGTGSVSVWGNTKRNKTTLRNYNVGLRSFILSKVVNKIIEMKNTILDKEIYFIKNPKGPYRSCMNGGYFGVI